MARNEKSKVFHIIVQEVMIVSKIWTSISPWKNQRRRLTFTFKQYIFSLFFCGKEEKPKLFRYSPLLNSTPDGNALYVTPPQFFITGCSVWCVRELPSTIHMYSHGIRNTKHKMEVQRRGNRSSKVADNWLICGIDLRKLGYNLLHGVKKVQVTIWKLEAFQERVIL